VTGRFITLEGGEGVGKSTQLKSLAAALSARGIDLVTTREPGGSPGAEAIRALLLEGEVDRWTAETEALLFAAARSDHVARAIRPALDAGKWVLCDRFLDSSVAYQGIVGAIGAREIRSLHDIGSGGFLPDRTLLLHLPADEASLRTGRRDGASPDRFGARDRDFHLGVNKAFEQLAAADPDRIRMVDAGGGEAEVTARLLDAIQDLM
jgi:dTMP kinase